MNGVARIPEPWEWIRTRCCSVCGEKKPWAKFSPMRYWPDGTVKQVHSRCHVCDAKRPRGAYKAANAERLRTYQREWKRRKRATMKAEGAGRGGMLPVAPFCDWLTIKAEEHGGFVVLAELCGVSDRTLRRVMHESERVGLDLVDQCVTRVGGHINDLYPMEMA